MPDITVYTVILGVYDNLRAPTVIEPGVRYVCVTDQPLRCYPWEIQPAWMPYESAGRNSRIPKILSHLHFDSKYTIYHDGHFRLTAEPSRIIKKHLANHDLALYRHPCRKSIYKEMEICKREGIGYGEAMEKQVDNYRRCGIRDNLWSGGFIVRRNTTHVQNFNEYWWNEFINGCPRDQIALPMAQLLANIPIYTIDADVLSDKRWIELMWHAAFVNHGDNASFEEERKARADKFKKLKELCHPI